MVSDVAMMAASGASASGSSQLPEKKLGFEPDVGTNERILNDPSRLK